MKMVQLDYDMKYETGSYKLDQLDYISGRTNPEKDLDKNRENHKMNYTNRTQ